MRRVLDHSFSSRAEVFKTQEALSLFTHSGALMPNNLF